MSTSTNETEKKPEIGAGVSILAHIIGFVIGFVVMAVICGGL